MFRHKLANKVLISRKHAQISIFSHEPLPSENTKLLSIHKEDYLRDIKIMSHCRMTSQQWVHDLFSSQSHHKSGGVGEKFGRATRRKFWCAIKRFEVNCEFQQILPFIPFLISIIFIHSFYEGTDGVLNEALYANTVERKEADGVKFVISFRYNLEILTHIHEPEMNVRDFSTFSPSLGVMNSLRRSNEPAFGYANRRLSAHGYLQSSWDGILCPEGKLSSYSRNLISFHPHNVTTAGRRGFSTS